MNIVISSKEIFHPGSARTIAVLLFFIFSSTVWAQTKKTTDLIEDRFVSYIRQLTFDGKRAGEGYFSSDGKTMVFQSERLESNPFFQIYLLDFEFGDVTPVSPGIGKTTCAWIHPNNKDVLFSSTQDDPDAINKQKAEIKFRESGKTRRYSWDYDENYELYSFNTQSKSYQRLTHAEGYDAEGSYSPDGKLIAFASNRNAYSQTLSERQQKAFELDPAVMMDIFVMKSDGSEVKQLTTVAGYDGGPFFSPDGQRICWRRFAENGATAEIMSMAIDGSDQKQLTRLGKMSWAPFYHPSGRYLIFTTNKHGFSNFELYIVDTEGQSSPVRITDTAGFDGLASFSPDGKQLTWTSNRNDKKQSQIYLADWNHDAALKSLGLQPSESVVVQRASIAGNESARTTQFDFEARDIMRHVDYLCRKELGGRMTGSVGERQATAYVAAYLKHLGLEPAANGQWFQNFDFPAGAKLGPSCSLKSADGEYPVDQDWRPIAFSKTGPIETSTVTFVGYGIVAEETENQPVYDSYGDEDVQGKWVMMFRFLPEDVDENRRAFLAKHSALRRKVMVARDKGAIGVIFVSGPTSSVREQLIPLSRDFSAGSTSIAAISVTDNLAAAWLSKSNVLLEGMQKRLDQGEQFAPIQLDQLHLESHIDVKPLTGSGRNVIGRLLASDQPSDEAILIGAHIDHLGIGATSSLAKTDEKGKIHVGADDNASGVAALLEIAEFLSGLKKQGRFPMRRDLIFAAWSGEELGLFGSKHYAKQITLSLNNGNESLKPYSGDPHNLDDLAEYYSRFINEFDRKKFSTKQFDLLRSNLGDMKIVIKLLGSTAANEGGRNQSTIDRYSKLIEKSNKLLNKIKTREPDSAEPNSASPTNVVACLNMDMIGRMKDKLVLQGLGSSSEWASIIEKANVVVGLPLETSDDTKLPTDASSFYQIGVPILSAFTGSHKDYHTPRDTPEKLNYPDAARIAKLVGLIARNLSQRPNNLKYIKRSEKQEKRVATTGRRARLGTIPNYTEKVQGVLLDDVEENGPADQAGLKAGDTIVNLAGKKIESIYDYQYAIDGLKVGRKTTISVIREGETLQLDITPGSRD